MDGAARLPHPCCAQWSVPPRSTAIMSIASSNLRGHLPSAPAVVVVLVLLLVSINLHADSRLERVRARGFLVCGVSTGIVGFAVVDAQGRWSGLDVDICRSVAAAIFGTGEKVHYVETSTVEQFLSSTDVDMVSRRLTWSLRREVLGLLFGPVTFYDGQGFLVPARMRVTNARQLSGAKVCVEPGTPAEFNLGSYFRANNLDLKKVLVTSADEIPGAFKAGRC